MCLVKIQNDFEIFRSHCAEIRSNYNTYSILFSNENPDILSIIAPTFFSDIAEILHRDWILQVCKIMDPATSKVGGETRENIGINLIDLQLNKLRLKTPDIKKLSSSLLLYGAKLKPARNRRIAHFDRLEQVYASVLGETTEDELKRFLVEIQAYCDEVGNIIGCGPADFSCSSCKGDVIDFFTFIRNKCTI
jgi:hypothetical protein